jgi:hypothetical protein
MAEMLTKCSDELEGAKGVGHQGHTNRLLSSMAGAVQYSSNTLHPEESLVPMDRGLSGS